MKRAEKIEKKTENRFLNFYEYEVETRSGSVYPYYVASRAENIEKLKINTGINAPDGVIIFAVYREEHQEEKLVLLRQYRHSIGGYLYEIPAGLVEQGEDCKLAATRELREETGLNFEAIDTPAFLQKAYYTTIGLTDESCATVYGYASGKIRSDLMEDTEEIETVLATREEAMRILKEEEVALPCGYALLHFIADEEPFGFLKKFLEK